MSVNITIAVPLETIAAIQSSSETRLTPEVLGHVTPALIQAAKGLPVTCTVRNGDQKASPKTASTPVADKAKGTATSTISSAQKSLVPQKRSHEETKGASDTDDASGTETLRHSEFKIQVIPRGEPHRVLSLVVRPSYTIEILKEMISDHWKDFPTRYQCLHFRRLPLNDSDTVRNAGMSETDTIYMDPGSPVFKAALKAKCAKQTEYGESITAKLGAGWSRPFYIPLSTTIKEMKRLIEDRESIPPDQQRLCYGGKELQEELYPEDDGYHENKSPTLALYGIKANGTIDVITQLKDS